MIMFKSFGRSWSLMKSSFSVRKSDKELVVFPFLSGAVSLLALIAFILPLIVLDIIENEMLFYVGLFAYYFVVSFVAIFFNAALVGAASIRLNGGDPTVRDGFNIAMENLPSIAGWAAISATVGLILRVLAGKSRSNALGRIAVGLIGGAWSLVTVFVVPVLVIEKVGPIEAIKRSTGIVKNKFGELVIGQLGLGLASIAVYIVAIASAVVLVMLLSAVAGGPGLIAGIIIGVMLVVAAGILMSALNAIFIAALYHYAKTGQDPREWHIGEMVAQAGGEQGRIS
jgi:membrane-anchored glycerophosphoryl diester phosphodiesterase (GDPDase)